jgi:hypothetical protein
MILLADAGDRTATARHGRGTLRHPALLWQVCMQWRGVHRIQRSELRTNIAHDGRRIANRLATSPPLRRGRRSNMCFDAWPHEHPLRMPAHAAAISLLARLLHRDEAQPRGAQQRHPAEVRRVA